MGQACRSSSCGQLNSPFSVLTAKQQLGSPTADAAGSQSQRQRSSAAVTMEQRLTPRDRSQSPKFGSRREQPTMGSELTLSMAPICVDAKGEKIHIHTRPSVHDIATAQSYERAQQVAQMMVRDAVSEARCLSCCLAKPAVVAVLNEYHQLLRDSPVRCRL